MKGREQKRLNASIFGSSVPSKRIRHYEVKSVVDEDGSHAARVAVDEVRDFLV